MKVGVFDNRVLVTPALSLASYQDPMTILGLEL